MSNRDFKEQVASLVLQLHKEQKKLQNKDEYFAGILAKICKEADLLLKWKRWSDVLEDCAVDLYKYSIPLSQKTSELIYNALIGYQRPEKIFRGPDDFGELREVLEAFYAKGML